MRFSVKFTAVPAALAAAAMLMAASPAAAQTEATSVQISGEVHRIAEDADTAVGRGDNEFSQLFASWKSLDNGLGITQPAATSAISVPSRMPLKDMRMSSGYGMRNHPVLGRRANHKGVDLAAPTGTPVYATADGMVAKAEWFSSYGNYIQIEHGGEMQTRYAHLSAYSVQAGSRVQKGDLIGYVGSTGRSTGPHLHYE
ncbi:MAG: M23 family metallopeptidase, partial [Proteobacteria bacterium]